MSRSEYWTEFMRRRISRRGLLGAGATAGLGLWASSAVGCGGAAKPSETGQGQASAAQRGGTLRYNRTTVSEWSGVDPYLSRNFADPAYERLIKYNPMRDKFLPSLAESWEVPNDTTYIFKLKKGVKFHNLPPVNGREMTAEDAKYSMERGLTEGGPYPLRPYFTSIEKAEAADKYTLKITTKAPFAPLLSNIASMSDFIMPKEIVGSDNVANTAVGTGPFMFDRWDRGDKLVWKRNPDYHVSGQPYLDGIEDRMTPDYATTIAVFNSDQTDIITIYAEYTKAIREKRPKAQILEGASLTQRRFFFRTGFKPTDDLRVRQAMDLMIPRAEMAVKIAGGTGEPFAFPTGPVDQFLENWALPNEELRKRISYMEKYPKEEALAQAKKLMAEAGYPDGFDMEALSTPDQWNLDTTVMVQDYLKPIGIRITIKTMDAAAYTATLIKGDFQMSVDTTGAGNPDPDGQIYPYVRSGSPTNWGKWSDPVLDKMLDEQRATMDEAKRKAIVYDIQRRILDTVPCIWTYDWYTYITVSERIHNLPAVKNGSFKAWDYMGEVWMEKK